MSNKPTPAYAVRLLVRLWHKPGTLGRMATRIGEAGGNITRMEGFVVRGDSVTREIIVDAGSEEHISEIIDAVNDVEGIDVIESSDMTFHVHEGGKLDTVSRRPLVDAIDLSMAYTPGVARVSQAVADDESLAFTYTIRQNTVAIISDGSAVLGLGDIGPIGALPVMEGKAVLFNEFAGVNAFPICVDVNSTEELIAVAKAVAPTFGGINLEDIAAPGAFEVEERLRDELDIPVFHDDQHGTAIVTLAALLNAAKVVGKPFKALRVVMVGAGAAGVAVAKILSNGGIEDIVVCDRIGAIHSGRPDLTSGKQWLADNTNPRGVEGTVAEAMVGADVFIGVSGPGVAGRAEVETMADKPIVFAMANPDPEIRPEDVEDIVAVMATGRSDYPNQINNVLAFPGVFRGAFDAGAHSITEGMKLAAALAIAGAVQEPTADYIVPNPFNKAIAPAVAAAVAKAAVEDGVVRTQTTVVS
ncbi:MAG: NAD-dependent malic enzyme [Acidimicrobiia bacterium]|nr:NAD-dependent malic enzyme [Acidimicrobiia bacterium]NNL26984.1 NAD-dependent malic enzyme [Acidimicrobiia bacterium]